MKKRKKIACAVSAIILSHYAQSSDNVCDKKKNPQCSNVTQAVSEVLPTVSVVANRSETDISKYAGQISVVEGNGLQQNENVVRDLGVIPGFQSGYDYGRVIGSNFALRGYGYQSENRVIIKQDGVRRSVSLFSNHISSFRADTGLLKRVEVVKGTSSILHGSGAIGGIVSMRTKDARDFIRDEKDVGFTMGVRRETNNLTSGKIAFAADPENIPIDVLVYAKKSILGNIKQADGGFTTQSGKVIDKTFNDENIKVGFIKVGYDITDDMRASVSIYNYEEKLDTVWQNIYHNSDFASDPIKGKLKQKDYVFDFSYKPVNNQLIDVSLKAYKSDASYYRAWADKNPEIYDNYYDNQDSRWGVSLKNISLFNTGSINHQVVAGFEYEDRTEDAIFYSGGNFSDFGSFPNYYKDTGFYIQDNATYGIFDITIGGRYDYFKRGVNREGKKSYSASHFSPKFAIAVEAFEGVNLLAGYSETFRGPTPNETSAAGPLNPHYYYLPNVDLKPEIAKEIEVGFSIDKSNVFTADDSLYMKATYFDGNIEDMISIKQLPELGPPPKSRTYAQYQNIGKANRKGVEIEAKYHVGAWNFNVAYDHLKLTDKETGKRLNNFADKLVLGAGYTHEPWGLSVGVQVRHWLKPSYDKLSFKRWGRTYDYVNRDYTIVDLKGKWTPHNTGVSFLDDGFSMNFGVNNVFDDEFKTANDFKQIPRTGIGRNIYVELEKTF